MLHKLLIANRGEIAVRIIRAAHELGIATVAVYSDADERAMHVRLADEAIHIGPANATKSYLKGEAIIEAAYASNADAIHPGYGFLAENAAFAALCRTAGIVFVGPSPEAIAQMGDKALARKTAKSANVPIVPGSEEPISILEEAERIAKSIGFPLLVKAAAGGGGRGIRSAEDLPALRNALLVAQLEAQAAFKDGSVYLERMIEHARHVEVQILGDGERAIHLLERECSLQRRRQKIVEEGPSPFLTPELRTAMTGAAVRLAEAVGYKGAGTIEFLVDPTSENFYFIEMNTRIQVEHPVTELICGVDLVQEQLTIAAGQALSLRQEDVHARGWAIECRINAEDPDNNFMPSPGVIEELQLPGGPGVRIDTALYRGYQVPHHYDSLLAKVIVWAPTRQRAIQRMRGALRELQIEGVKTTRPLLQRVMDDMHFRSGDYHTGFLEEWLQANSELPE